MKIYLLWEFRDFSDLYLSVSIQQFVTVSSVRCTSYKKIVLLLCLKGVKMMFLYKTKSMDLRKFVRFYPLSRRMPMTGANSLVAKV